MFDQIDVNNLSNDAKAIITYVQLEFEKMKSELTTFVNSKNTEINVLKEEVLSLKNHVFKLENLIDESDAYERRDSLVFSGPGIPVVSQHENCSQLVQQLAKDKLNCIISPTDVSTAHRLGKPPNTQKPDQRSIIVKFCRRDVKHQLYAARKNQSNANRIYVNESLTPSRQDIFHTLRKIRKTSPNLIAGISTYDGKVFAYTKPEAASSSSATNTQRDRRHLVNNKFMLEEFCENFLKRPLSNFLDSFNQ